MSLIESSNRAKIALTEDNFFEWSLQVKFVLRGQGVEEFIMEDVKDMVGKRLVKSE